MTPRHRSPERPRFYFSFRSPYSWLAHHDLLLRHAAVARALEWIPFWEPDEVSGRMLAEAGGSFAYTPMSRAKHLYILQDVRRLAAQRGLKVRWPVDLSPRWEVPHLAYIVAARHGQGRAFVGHLYRARWEQGRDVCHPPTISDIAEECGLDADELAGASEDPEVRAEGVRALLAVHRDGVFGVPFFVHRFDKYWGMERLEAFVLSLAGRGTPPSVDGCGRQGDHHEPEGGARLGGDAGHAGGCG